MAQREPGERRHPPKLRLTRRRAEGASPASGAEQARRAVDTETPDVSAPMPGSDAGTSAESSAVVEAPESGAAGPPTPEPSPGASVSSSPGPRRPRQEERRPREAGRGRDRAGGARAPGGRAAEPAPEVVVRGQGWRIIAAKEFADHILSVRFLVLLLLVGIATIAAVYTAANGISGAASQASGTPALFLELFTAAPQQLPPFFVLIGFLAPLLGIAFGFDAVNGERAQGTLSRLLSQPIYRDDVVNGKFVAGLSVIGLILTCITLLVAGIGMVRLGIVPSPEDVTRIILWLIVAILYVGFWLAFSILCSIVLRRAATSALTAIAVWLVLTLFAALLVGLVVGVLAPLPAQPTLSQAVDNAQLQLVLSSLSPGTLYTAVTAVLLDPTVTSVGIVLPSQTSQALPSILPVEQSLLVAWPQLVALVALTVVCFALAYALFMRQEVRA